MGCVSGCVLHTCIIRRSVCFRGGGGGRYIIKSVLRRLLYAWVCALFSCPEEARVSTVYSSQVF